MASEWIDGMDDDSWINQGNKKRVGELYLVHYPSHKDKVNNTNHIRYGEFYSDQGYMTDNYMKVDKKYILSPGSAHSRVVDYNGLVDLFPENFI